MLKCIKNKHSTKPDSFGRNQSKNRAVHASHKMKYGQEGGDQGPPLQPMTAGDAQAECEGHRQKGRGLKRGRRGHQAQGLAPAFIGHVTRSLAVLLGAQPPAQK